MSDSQEAKRERRLQQRIADMEANGYGALNADRVYELAINSPAGVYFDSGAGGLPWAPGTVLERSKVEEIVSNVARPGFYEGADGLTVDTYLSDPRAAVRLEGDQYVYRPEQMQGDFASIDRQSFFDDWGVAGLIVGAMGGLPIAASLAGAAGAAGAASAAEAASLAAVNTFDSGAMASILGTTPAAAPTAAAGAATLGTLTAPAGAGTVATAAGALKSAASIAGSVGTIAQSASIIDRITSGSSQASGPALLPIGSSATQPLILNLGADPMATKTAASQPQSAPAAPLNLQALLPIAVLVVAVLALGKLEGE